MASPVCESPLSGELVALAEDVVAVAEAWADAEALSLLPLLYAELVEEEGEEDFWEVCVLDRLYVDDMPALPCCVRVFNCAFWLLDRCVLLLLLLALQAARIRIEGSMNNFILSK